MTKRYYVYLYLLCLTIYLCLKDIVLLNLYLVCLNIYLCLKDIIYLIRHGTYRVPCTIPATHLQTIAVRCHPRLRGGQTPLPYAPFVRLPWARPTCGGVCPRLATTLWQMPLFIFCEYFLGVVRFCFLKIFLGATTPPPPHTIPPQGRCSQLCEKVIFCP